MNNADMPAMPSGVAQDYNNPGCDPLNYGLTKREYFAAMAMQGILANPGCAAQADINIGRAFDHADEMLKFIEEGKE